jgi:hypothetical protein
MTRAIEAATQAKTEQQYTDPVHLVMQDMGAAILYHSDRELVDHDGNDYVATTGLSVDNLTNRQVTWSVDNSDHAISIQALANDVGGNVVNVYLYYGVQGEAVLRFTGAIDEWFTAGQRVVFRATAQATRFQMFPNERVENGVFNHLPAAGSAFDYNGQSIIIESEAL